MMEGAQDWSLCVVKVLTPYCIGSGVVLIKEGFIITNEHIVRGNARVAVENEWLSRQMVDVVYLDDYYDLAFLRLPEGLEGVPEMVLHEEDVRQGDAVMTMGYEEGYALQKEFGVVEHLSVVRHNIRFFQHTAETRPGFSGGPVMTEGGRLVGINTEVRLGGREDSLGLPVDTARKALAEFLVRGAISPAVRCFECRSLQFEDELSGSLCTSCGSELQLIGHLVPYEPSGIQRTIERLLEDLGYRAELARAGERHWEIVEGSAKIAIAYHEKSGMIIGEAYLCGLPENEKEKFFAFVLQQNEDLRSLTFSIKDQKVVLTMLIYDHFLQEETGKKMFRNLFETADHYDDILIHQFGATSI